MENLRRQRPKKIWKNTMKNDMMRTNLLLTLKDAKDREMWKHHFRQVVDFDE